MTSKQSVNLIDREKYPIEQLLFRRQFILGPRFVEALPRWRKLALPNGFHLTAHPELSVCQRASADQSITLLGYVLDPYRPEADDAQILDSLFAALSACGSLDQFFKCTYSLGGRWILIVSHGNESLIFHDALGQRQICYTDHSMTGELWCASQPGIIAETLSMRMSQDILDGFMASYNSRDQQYWWPYDLTPYPAIRHLSPNHYVNLRTGSRIRYWPDADLTELSMDEAVERCSTVLRGTIQGASKRFDLALALTSGWDSRMILAATRATSDQIYYFTMKYWNLNEKSADVQVPRKLLKRLGLTHHIIECPSRMEVSFQKLYNRNVTTAREVYGAIAQGLYDYYPHHRVCMKGNASATVKSNGPIINNNDISVSELAEFAGMKVGSLGAQYFDNWLRDTRDSCFNVNLRNLFYWEQRMGNWQAMSALEWDIVQEVLQPFNCRTLLVDMLSVNQHFRRGPDFALFKELIRALWPAVLKEPVNPRQNVPLLTRAYKKIARLVKGFVSPPPS